MSALLVIGVLSILIWFVFFRNKKDKPVINQAPEGHPTPAQKPLHIGAEEWAELNLLEQRVAFEKRRAKALATLASPSNESEFEEERPM